MISNTTSDFIITTKKGKRYVIPAQSVREILLKLIAGFPKTFQAFEVENG